MDVSPAIGIPYPIVCCVLGVRYKSIKWHLVSSVGVFGSESDVSPAIGIRFPRLPVCVESDVSPAIGSRFPVCVLFCLACVSRATNALILLRPRRYVCIGCDILASMCFP